MSNRNRPDTQPDRDVVIVGAKRQGLVTKCLLDWPETTVPWDIRGEKRGEQTVVGDDEFIFVLEPHRAVSLGVGEHVQRIE